MSETNKQQFNHIVAASGYTLPLAIVIAVATWTLHGGFTIDRILGLIICVLTMLILLFVDRVNNFIRTRTMLSGAIYIFLYACMPFLHTIRNDDYASLAMVSSYFFLFRCYHKQDCIVDIFHLFICLGIAILLFPPTLLFIPLYILYTGILVHKISWRTIFAAIIGLTTPFWIILPVIGYMESLADVWQNFFHTTKIFNIYIQHISQNELSILFSVLAICLITIVAGIHSVATQFNEKVRTRVLFNILMMQQVAIIVYIILMPTLIHSLVALLVMNSAPILAHYFAIAHGKTVITLFVIFLLTMPSIPFLEKFILWITI